MLLLNPPAYLSDFFNTHKRLQQLTAGRRMPL